MPNEAPHSTRRSISFAIVGSGGAGALTAGAILMEAAGKAGWYGIMNRSVGAQIRGGEAAALVRLSTRPVDCMTGSFDILIAIDWHNANRFAAEMPLAPDGLVIGDPANGDVPETIAGPGVSQAYIPFKELAGSLAGGRENMIAVGLFVGLMGLPIETVTSVIADKLSEKGEQAIETGCRCVQIGVQQAAQLGSSFTLETPATSQTGRWLITGNEAVGLGAVRGGIRFAAAYPITPATEVLEWLAPALTKVGGTLVQAEDELASISMAIGASFGGRPSITATSGPGLALMVESLGLAAASEIPIVVVNVMRGGPSTGIPTKSEQSDLNIAVYGCHGDAPRIVVAPLSVADCLFAAQWAVHLAEAMQVPTIVLSDQSLGQAQVVVDPPTQLAFIARRAVVETVEDEGYQRYALTGSSVSPMALPGTTGGQYTADGLSHTVKGIPSSNNLDHQSQLDKRHNKIAGFDYGNHWASIEDNGVAGADADFTILTWGSLTGAAREAMATLADEGIGVTLVAMRLIAPLLKDKLVAALEGAQRILILEQTHSGQFRQYLRANCDLPGEVQHFHRAGPQLIGPAEICTRIRNWRAS
ncbi:MAG: 2-oxoacid:acceptor oxidoreductase subunit alpha [Hyphomicrobiales bacterium]|nr:2-oxoacid:acceptor oxidoreductase subunit alpha [Hyphomicrobiales bacterium]MCP4998853.1 2-oxoacid:acceptor oxidoreductase subunit alpha [Hyphomicrobiales bacterium]